MPDILDATGLTVKTAAEITASLAAGLQGIYGADINIDSNSPDGQAIGIITQAAVDIRELLVSINNSFDPDQAVGTPLDWRAAINNVERHGGSYTVQPITITCNAPVTLAGLDANFDDPNGTGFTVQDASGNKFILSTTTTLGIGATVCDFRAALIGNVNVPINTITIPVTIVPGVTSVNNPTGAVTIGANEEVDPKFRIRRSQSVANGSAGYLNGLLGKILDLPGVTEAVLYENVTDSVDGNGIPAHGIWLVVAGGSNADIANMIYANKSYSSNMKGAQTYNITTASGGLFVAKWDTPAAETLYMRFTIKTTVPSFGFDQASIKSYIAANAIYGIGAYAETSALTAIAAAGIAAQGGGGVPLLVEISDDGATWVDYLTPTNSGTQFVIASGNITITVI